MTKEEIEYSILDQIELASNDIAYYSSSKKCHNKGYAEGQLMAFEFIQYLLKELERPTDEA